MGSISNQPAAGKNSTASKQQLSAWGLPQPILEAFHKKGLKQLYPWQAAALECAAAGNNLVYSAPTSGGKSLVADVLMLSRLHKTQEALAAKLKPQKGRKPQQQPVTRALIVLPYLSIVSEKSQHLSKLLEPVRWRVKGYKGDDADGQPLSHPAERISICSIEKASGSINKLIQEQRLHELVSVTIDEAHMLADPNRGAALEMLLTKLIASRGKSNIQIVAMSATMSGLDSLSSWLNAHLFLTNFRPVPLTEHAVFEGRVFVKCSMQPQQLAGSESECILQEQRTLVEDAGREDKESLLALVTEVVAEGHSVLVFCAGRAGCQGCADMLSKELPKRLGPPSPATAAARTDLIEQLRISLSGVSDAAFEKLLAAGVAYHHAGLTHQERAIVEQGFSSGALLVLTATSTLAAGVNLPAQRVILRSLWQGVEEVSRAQYLQMVGRAGRAGHSTIGEAYLMGKGTPHTNSGEWSKICQLLAAPLPVLHSQMMRDPSAAAANLKPPRSRAAAGLTQAITQQTQQQQRGGSTQSNTQQQQQRQQPGGQQVCSLPLGYDSHSGGGSMGVSMLGPASGHISTMSGGCSGGLASAGTGHTAAASGGNASHQGQQQWQEVEPSMQPNLQHLLLDAFATELATTGQSVLQLLQSTLAFFHVPWDVLAQAAQIALAALRARKLTTLLPDKPGKPSHWKLTPLGRAVVASALDPTTGLKLYTRLDRMRECMVLGGNVHLLYVLQIEAQFEIFDWGMLKQFLKTLTPLQRRVAEVEGIDLLYIERRLGGQRANTVNDDQLARFAAAVLLDWVVQDVNQSQQLVQAWGKPQTLTKAGFSRGVMQKWQTEISKTAAMAALLANEAEWWQLETLLAPLAAQVAAGVRPELLPLMKVPGMQPSHAAALHSAGLGHPDLLLCASESEVAAALAAGLPANMRKRKNLDKKGLNVGLTGNAGTNAMVSRAARSVLAAARQYTVQSAAEAAASALSGEDGDGEQAALAMQLLLPPIRTKALMGRATVHQVWPKKSDPLLSRLLDAWQLQSSFALAVVMHEQQCAAPAAAAAAAAAAAGSNGSGCSGLVCTGVAFGRQQQQGGGGAGRACASLHGHIPSALLLCWIDKEAVVLHLPPLHTRNGSGSSSSSSGGSSGKKKRRRSSRLAGLPVGAGGSSESAPAAAAAAAAHVDETVQWVWSVIDQVLGDPTRTVTCAGAVQVLAALSAAGIAVKAVVDDPCTAFSLWQPRGLDHAVAAAAAAADGGDGEQQVQEKQPAALTEETCKAAAAVLLGDAFKLHVPLLPGSNSAAATAAAKAVLLTRALMPPLRAMLAKQQLTAAYEAVQQPLQCAFADVRASGLCVSAQSLQQQVQTCDWQQQALQQRLSQMLGQQQQTQQQQTQQASSGLGDSDIRLLLLQQRLLTVSHEHLQQLPLLQLLQLALHAAVKRRYAAVLPLLRLLLTYCHVQQYKQQLQQLLRQYVVVPQLAADASPETGDSYSDSYGGVSGSGAGTVGVVVLQAHPVLEPITGQINPGLPSAFDGVIGFRPAPALPVLTSAASLAQQGFRSLTGSITVAAQVQQTPQDPQQQQQGELYVVGQLCAINAPTASVEQAQSTSQLLPWQVHEDPAAAAAAAAAGTAGTAGDFNAAGTHSSLPLPSQQQQGLGSSAIAATPSTGTVRVWCGSTETVRDLQLPTSALYSILRSPQLQQQQQQQQQQFGSTEGSSSSCLAYLPGSCSFSHVVNPSCSSNTFIGVQLQHLPLLVLAGLSQDASLMSAGKQQSDPVTAAAAAWLPSSGLPQQLQQHLLWNIQSGVLDGVPAPASAAPGLLFSVAVQALTLGLKPSAQREQLGAVEWPKGTNLADSLFGALPGLKVWRDKLLGHTQDSRFLTTPLGRRIPFRLPPSDPNQSKAAAKQLKEAQRSAVSLMLLASIGDVQRLVVGSMQRVCTAWQASNSSINCGNGGSNGGAVGGGASGGLEPAGSRQSQAASGGTGTNPLAVAVAAAAGASASGSGPPGRLLPGCHAAPSGFAVGAGGNGASAAQAVRFVAVSGSQVVLEVPSTWALPLLQCCCQQVGREVGSLLGLDGGVDSEGVEVGCKLPFRWWWGGSLNVLQGNAFCT